MATPQSVEQKIQNKETVTRAELQSMRASVAGLSKEKLAALDTQLSSYAQAKSAELAANADSQTELLALQQMVEDERRKGMSPLGIQGAEIGEKAGEMATAGIAKAKEITNVAVTEGGKLATETVTNAKALAYREFAAMQDPKKTTGEKILRGLGIMAVMYGAYRAAKWVVGKKNSGFLGRMFRFLGISALSVAAINYFGKNVAPSAPVASTPAATKPTPTPAPAKPAAPAAKPTAAPTAAPASLLASLPENKSLIDGTARSFILNGSTHTIAFTHKRIVLDGKNYGMTALKAGPFGGDVSLEISQAEKRGTSLFLEAGAYGKKGDINLDETTTASVVRTLLSTGSFDTKNSDNVEIRIARS